MAESRAASRYVKSLLGLAVEKNVLEQVHNDMLLFAKVVDENRAFALMLQNPIIKHDKKRASLQQIFQGKVNPLTMAIFDIITKKNREPILSAVAKGFHNAYNLYKGIGKATIVTAVPIDAEMRRKIEGLVKEIGHTREVEVIERVDPSIIGGFILNVGDKQIDASIKSKLKGLRVKFSQNPYVKEF